MQLFRNIGLPHALNINDVCAYRWLLITVAAPGDMFKSWNSQKWLRWIQEIKNLRKWKLITLALHVDIFLKLIAMAACKCLSVKYIKEKLHIYIYMSVLHTCRVILWDKFAGILMKGIQKLLWSCHNSCCNMEQISWVVSNVRVVYVYLSTKNKTHES